MLTEAARLVPGRTARQAELPHSLTQVSVTALSAEFRLQARLLTAANADF